MLFTWRADCSADHDRPPSRATPDPHPRQAQCQTFQETPAQLDLIASPTVPGSTAPLIVQFQFNFLAFSAFFCIYLPPFTVNKPAQNNWTVMPAKRKSERAVSANESVATPSKRPRNTVDATPASAPSASVVSALCRG